MVGFSQAVPVRAQVWGQVVHMWRRFAKWHAKGVHGDYVHPEGGGEPPHRLLGASPSSPPDIVTSKRPASSALGETLHLTQLRSYHYSHPSI